MLLPKNGKEHFRSFYMGMIGNVIHAVAVVTAAAGAIAEFQIGIGHIGAAAYGTFMRVGGFRLRNGRPVGPGSREGYRAGFGLTGGLFPEQSPGIDPPADRQDVDYILANEEEIVGERHQREQTVGEQTNVGHTDDINGDDGKINHREDPCLYGNDEEQQEMGIRIHGGIGQKQTRVQIGHSSRTIKDQTEDILQQNARQVVKIEPQGAPNIFQGFAHGKIAQQADCQQQGIEISVAVGQNIGKQPPYLPLQDQPPVKAQPVVQKTRSVKHAHDINQCRTKRDIQHQIWYAF